ALVLTRCRRRRRSIRCRPSTRRRSGRRSSRFMTPASGSRCRRTRRRRAGAKKRGQRVTEMITGARRMSHNGEQVLSGKQERALAALLSEPTVRAAADKVHVSVATMQRWLREPAFAAAYRQAQRQVFTDAVGALSAASTAAVEALRRNLD